METLRVRLLNTELKDRVLWYDGDSTVDSDKVSGLLAGGQSSAGLWVDSITDDIKQYNQLVSSDEQIKVKQQMDPISTEWILPESYHDLDPWDYVIDKFFESITDDNLSDTDVRVTRIATELVLYKELGLMDILRTLIYVINTLRKNNVVWGVGRGSSVSSYVLYIIGVHDVDSVEYDLDINDFLRVETKK